MSSVFLRWDTETPPHALTRRFIALYYELPWDLFLPNSFSERGVTGGSVCDEQAETHADTDNNQLLPSSLLRSTETCYRPPAMSNKNMRNKNRRPRLTSFMFSMVGALVGYLASPGLKVVWAVSLGSAPSFSFPSLWQLSGHIRLGGDKHEGRCDGKSVISLQEWSMSRHQPCQLFYISSGPPPANT